MGVLHRYLLALIAGLAVAGAAAQSAGLQGHRLAGLIEVDDGRWIALVETPDGQAVFRLGDPMADGVIEDIGSDGVIVARAGQRLLLPLEGDLVALASAAPSSDAMVVHDRVGMYAVDYDALRDRLREAGAPPDKDEARNPDYLSERLRAALELPVGTRIVSINQREPASGQEALLLATSVINSGRTLNLTVSGHGSADQIYVSDTAHSGGSTP